MKDLNIKIIVCTLGGENLSACLAALPSVDCVGVVVVNQSRHTLKGVPSGVIVIDSDPIGLSAARNLGMAAVPGAEYYVFIDDDAVPAPGYIDRLLVILRDSDADALAGAILCPDDGSHYSKAQSVKGGRLAINDWNRFMGGNFAVKGEVFRKIGRFDDRFGAGNNWACGEETDFFFRMIYAGFRVCYAPGVIVHHPREALEDASGAMLRRIFLYGKGHGALFAKHLFHYKKFLMSGKFLWSLFKPLIRVFQYSAVFNFSRVSVHRNILVGRIIGFKEYLFD